MHDVGVAGVYRRVLRPHPIPGARTFCSKRPDARALVRRQDREEDAGLRQQLQRFGVHGRFRQPHAFRPASKAMLEIRHAPHDLRTLVARRRQRHDDVVVHLGHRRAVTAKKLTAFHICFEDRTVRSRRALLQPGKQGGAKVEAHARVVVHDLRDLVALVHDARGTVAGVALIRNALVPIVVGCGRVLRLHNLKPGVLARRLIEVAMNAQEFHGSRVSWPEA